MGEDNRCYVMHEGLKMTLDNYKELIFRDIVNLKENCGLTWYHLVFKGLKMGSDWSEKIKRVNLVKELSLNSGVLSYDFLTYCNKPYTL